MFFIPAPSIISRTALLAAIVLSAISFSTPRAFAQQSPPEISWAFYQNECPAAASQADDWFRVGDFGYFYSLAGNTPITGCNRAAVSSCIESVRIYPKPSEAPLDIACHPLGGCNKQFDQMVGSWAFIPDLAPWHARMVDKVIRSTTDDKVDSKISIITASGSHGDVTDVDVYRVLAELAEAVDKGGTPRPSVINLSFGRVHQPGDAFSASCSQDQCYEGALSCQVARLLGYLTEDDPDDDLPPTVVVGSAGNDLVHLVPGVFEEVITTGMIDVTRLAAGTGTEPAWETPVLWNALMPGNGLCLELPLDVPPKPEPVWTDVPVPSGSSFSAAIMSGLAADLLRNEPDSFLDQLGQGHPWVPREDCTSAGCTFVLTNGVVALPSPSGKGSEFLHEAVRGDPSQCGMSGTTGTKWLWPSLLAPTGDPTVQLDSLPELTADTHRSTPEPRVCIPCVVDITSPLQGPGAQKATVRSGAADSLRRPIPPSQGTWVNLEIDLHGRWPLGGETTLHGLYLRFGSQFRQLELTDMQLEQIKMGMVDYIGISAYFTVLDLSEQPSLISVLSREDLQADREDFYRSTPTVYR